MTKQFGNIAVIGAGAWGTALAQILAEAGRHVSLYARAPELAARIGKNHENDIYLPGIRLNSQIRATADPAAAAAKADVLLFATPAQFMRSTLMEFKSFLRPHTILVNCAKGIEMATGKLLSEVAAEILPGMAYAVLSGPTFAHEAAKGLPAAVTFATAAPGAEAQHWARALSSKTFRPYLSHDPVGAEIAGALKNVIAIACGIVEGQKLGQNARAAVMTRGMAEIKRLGLHKGAAADTFLGLSGIGDLTLTCHSMSSRNFSLGVALGSGRKLEDVLAERRTVAEGVSTARAIAASAHQLQVEMPISLAVDKILHHKAEIGAVIRDLLARDLKQEAL